MTGCDWNGCVLNVELSRFYHSKLNANASRLCGQSSVQPKACSQSLRSKFRRISLCGLEQSHDLIEIPLVQTITLFSRFARRTGEPGYRAFSAAGELHVVERGSAMEIFKGCIRARLQR